ncbi:hypothetical protein VPH35_115269 [Triticum aestivum]|uniref:Uncharacterized protein n=1 Tax=Aegilops tauschii TaxID=37682 RepID=R7VZ32_AEGTA
MAMRGGVETAARRMRGSPENTREDTDERGRTSGLVPAHQVINGPKRQQPGPNTAGQCVSQKIGQCATEQRYALRTMQHMAGLEPYDDIEFLLYDPMVSPHYEVLAAPSLCHNGDSECCLDPAMEASEWPPLLLACMSSRQGQDVGRKGFLFDKGMLRELAVGEIQAMNWSTLRAVYWRGALYVHALYPRDQADFVMSLPKFKKRAGQNFEWASDEDDAIDAGYEAEESYCGPVDVLGSIERQFVLECIPGDRSSVSFQCNKVEIIGNMHVPSLL